MSTVTSAVTSQAVHPDLDPWHGILYTVIEHLAPLFKSAERGATYARYAAGKAIAAFNPESRADYTSIGRILALSLSAITVAAQSTDPSLPAAERLRFLNKVQSLSRTADQAERTMMARRRLAPREDIADTLIPRPANRPARYHPLPPDDPACGAAIAARTRERQQAAEAGVDRTNSTPKAANFPQSNQTNSTTPQVAENQRHPSGPQPPASRSGYQANPVSPPLDIARIDQTKSPAQGPESHGRIRAGDQIPKEELLQSFVRGAFGPPSDRRTLERALGLADRTGRLTR
jgi:hypothetical protein